MSRLAAENLHKIPHLPFDVVIVGGGIIGAGIARDAALRGLRVALFEKNDFGSGTTAGSTRLIHGGLRYLQMLDFRLVRMDLTERETLLRIAPHLVRPLRFFIPFYDADLFQRVKLRAGMWLYDLLSFDKTLPGHGILSAKEMLEAEPNIESKGLQGGAAYYDAQVNSPERLCLENILNAREHGAVTLNYVEVIAAIREDGRIAGVRVRDRLDGSEAEVRSNIVVNASGPWFDRVATLLDTAESRRIRTTKGVHIACDRLLKNAVALTSRLDGRLFFLIPYLNYTWIGTTDTDYDGDPAQARARADDVDYLIRSAQDFVPELANAQIHWTNAGVRALVMQEGSESSVSRLHRIAEHWPGLISVMGGKITGYRAIAQEVTDLLCRKLDLRRRCTTGALPLPGAGEINRQNRAIPEHLWSTYGSLAEEVWRLVELNSELGRPFHSSYPDIPAQVIHAIRSEQCVSLSDFMLRRSLLGFSPDQGLQAVDQVVMVMARELHWPASRTAAELAEYRRSSEESRRSLTERVGSCVPAE